MKIAKQKSTGKWINDFQSNATSEGLLRNALARGIPENDVEIQDVDKATFGTIVAEVTAPGRLIVEQEDALTQTELKNIGQAIMTKLSLTKAQMKKFILFMRQIDVDSF